MAQEQLLLVQLHQAHPTTTSSLRTPVASTIASAMPMPISIIITTTPTKHQATAGTA